MSTAANTSRFAPRSRAHAIQRRLIAVAVLFGAVFALLVGQGAASASNQPVSASSLLYVTILEGQSLWSLAEELEPDADPRQFVEEVMTTNGLESASVQPGQRIAIPQH